MAARLASQAPSRSALVRVRGMLRPTLMGSRLAFHMRWVAGSFVDEQVGLIFDKSSAVLKDVFHWSEDRPICFERVHGYSDSIRIDLKGQSQGSGPRGSGGGNASGGRLGA